ncbi:MAG: acyl-CoA desaturase [Actinomycetota bacterium]|nr:acyl-CoA desaturase [Actinomycetota bacterium]
MVNRSTLSINDDYTALSAQIREAGMMNQRLGPYAIRGALTLLALGAGWAGLFALGDTWLTLVVAAWLGLVFTQVVFFGHDAGHHQIFSSRRGNQAVGLVAGNLLTGLSFGWWVPKHGAHHAHPNQVGRDPDIGAGAVAFTAEVAAGRRRLGRLAARWQAWSFFPLLTLEGAGLHLASVQSLLRRKDRAARAETALMAAHAVAYLVAVFWVLSPARAVAFIAVQQGVFGLYLGCSFAPNHKGMPTIDADARVGFAERQVLTARNVSGGRLIAFLLGGLNYQIEHHLFPRMPRANLARCQPLIRAYCARHGLVYRQESIVGSYRSALTHLRSIGSGGLDPRLPPLPSARLATPALQRAV